MIRFIKTITLLFLAISYSTAQTGCFIDNFGSQVYKVKEPGELDDALDQINNFGLPSIIALDGIDYDTIFFSKNHFMNNVSEIPIKIITVDPFTTIVIKGENDSQINFSTACFESENVIFNDCSIDREVINTSDSGLGSLREAIKYDSIMEVNVRINIGDQTTDTIFLQSNLPSINRSFRMSSDNSSGSLVLDGRFIEGNSGGLRFYQSSFLDSNIKNRDVNVSGIQFQHFVTAIDVEYADNVSIDGNVFLSNELGFKSFKNELVNFDANYVGTNHLGVDSMPNVTGLSLYKDDSIQISRNTISNNSSVGIWVYTQNDGYIVRNKIGTNKEGTKKIGSQEIGIRIAGGGQVTIGRTPNSFLNGKAPNVISGNGTGIYIENDRTVEIAYNTIGLNDDQTDTIPNQTGVFVKGLVYMYGNTIGGNDKGINFFAPTSGEVSYVFDNVFGKDEFDPKPLPNNIAVYISRLSSDHTIELEDNLISNSIQSGILIDQYGSKKYIYANIINNNGRYGIEMINSRLGENLDARNNRYKGNALGGINEFWEDLTPVITYVDSVTVIGRSLPFANIEVSYYDPQKSVKLQGAYVMNTTVADENGFWEIRTKDSHQRFNATNTTALAIDTLNGTTRTSAFSKLFLDQCEPIHYILKAPSHLINSLECGEEIHMSVITNPFIDYEISFLRDHEFSSNESSNIITGTGDYEYVIKDPHYDFCETRTDTIKAEDLCVSSLNKSLNEVKLSIYPNPAQNLVFIKGDLNDQSYQIINTYGELINEGTLENNSIGIDQLDQGVYVLNVDGISLKFIKN